MRGIWKLLFVVGLFVSNLKVGGTETAPAEVTAVGTVCEISAQGRGYNPITFACVGAGSDCPYPTF